MAADQFVFVHSEPSGPHSKADQFLIRSHSMKGKNVKPDSRRSTAKARREAAKASNRCDGTAPGAPSEYDFAYSLRLLQQRSWTPIHIRSMPTLLPVAPGLAYLAETALRSPRELLNDLTTFARINETWGMLDSFIDFNLPSDGPPLPSFDNSTIHGMLIINSAVHDYAQNRPFTEKTAPIVVKTLGFLNQKLTAKEAFLEDSTIHTVSLLAAVACSIGDLAAFKTHMSALHKIISTRGWFRSSRAGDGLSRYKTECMDMILALSLGSEPYFLTVHGLNRDPQPVKMFATPAPSDTGVASFLRPLNLGLKAIYLRLRELIVLLNRHINAKQKINIETYGPALRSITVSLLRTERTLKSPSNICFGVGMLCFILSIFQIPTMPPTYEYITGRLRAATAAMKEERKSPSQGLNKWILIMSAISIFNPTDPWLHATWADTPVPIGAWNEVSQQLKQILWIDYIHDKLVKAAFVVLTRPRS
ncbi:hypothetical protein HJFPF1_10553 [Paramyrothecium foliicola]|nr:hypothetical protein HJFPF1_10553 [Paramyrothecium foliicola]